MLVKEEKILQSEVDKLLSGEKDFSYLGEIKEVRFTPFKVKEFFKDRGYTFKFGSEDGWEQDTEYYFDKDDIRFVLSYSGFYFTIDLYLEKGEKDG